MPSASSHARTFEAGLWLGCGLLVLIIVFLNRWSGYQWSLFVLHGIPVAILTWRLGPARGFLLTFFCVAGWWWAIQHDHPYISWGPLLLAGLSRWTYVAAVAAAFAALRHGRELDRARIRGLEYTRELERQILCSVESEHRRIGRDLHDGLGSHLAALLYSATFLAGDLRKMDSPHSAAAEKLRDQIDDASEIVRSLSHGMASMAMTGGGLVLALENLARSASLPDTFTVSFREIGQPAAFPMMNGLHLYRIAQEAVHNALKHGRAQQVTIVLSRDRETLRLAIADDGCGIPHAEREGEGLGLQSMHHRAHALGSELEIESHPGEGTVVSCSVPLFTNERLAKSA